MCEIILQLWEGKKGQKGGKKKSGERIKAAGGCDLGATRSIVTRGVPGRGLPKAWEQSTSYSFGLLLLTFIL